MEASGLLTWGGASALAVIAVARWRPGVALASRVRREAIDIDLVREQLQDDVATDGENRGDRPMAMTTDMPVGQMPTPMPGATPSAGLPPEQLYTWLEWVQDDLRRVETQLETLEVARTQLREQERLLGELLHSAAPQPAANARR